MLPSDADRTHRPCMQSVTSRQNPLVRSLRALAAEPDPEGRRLLLDGVHLLRAAINAGVSMDLVAVAASRLDEASEEGDAARALDRGGTVVVSVADRVFPALSPLRTPSGIVAVARRQAFDPAEVCGGTDPLVLGVLHVQDPGNLGALLRAAEAGGATGALVGGGSASPFSWKAVRGSMGAVLRLPVVAGITSTTVVACLRTRGLRMIASVPRGGTAPEELDWTGGIGLLLGGEGSGIDDSTVSACDARVSIPMAAPVESLNVASAAAILIYAARRQRA